MKTSEIKVGARYTNGKGSVREVTGQGAEFVLYDGQHDDDCVQWKCVGRAKHGPAIGVSGSMTRNSFAAWAKECVA